jgi:hypothetical protein
MATGNEAANKGLRVLAGRSSAKPETPGGALPASVADVLAVPSADLEMTTAELEVKVSGLAQAYADATVLVGVARGRLEQ